jgi:hypothetical protein
MWMQEFHSLYPVATERYTGRSQKLSQVEDLVNHTRRGWEVNRRVLEIIEDPDSGWDYPKWWPRLSAQLEQPIPLPTHIYSQQGKRAAVKSLHEAIKNIEIVSVILRFMCPDVFGIFSPPVASFLHVSPLPSPIETYLMYLNVLKSFVEHYKVLKRVADIDMAMWSAAHLVHDPAYASLKEEMYGDEFFHDIRLRNLVKGLEGFWRRTGMQRLIFARVFLERDYVLAAVIVARVYEPVLREMMEYYGLLKSVSQKIDLASVQQLERRSEIESLGFRQGELAALWKLRNKAVHGDLDFTPKKAGLFVQGVEQVWQAWRKRGSKTR